MARRVAYASGAGQDQRSTKPFRACIDNRARAVVSFRAVELFPATAEQGDLGNRTDRAHASHRALLLLCGIATLLCAGLLVYSQTMSFVWDEGFHLIAAQLIDGGKMPYRDFCFPQTPLNAYWNAAWMEIFGETWRVTHVLAALEVAGAAFLTAQFLLSRFPVPRWRLAGAIVVMLFVGLDNVIVQFGTVAQAYGVCLFLIVVAFRFSVAAVERNAFVWAMAAGLFAGAAADSSLLTAPVIPVLLLWIFLYNRAGNRWAKSTAFVAGALISFLPLLWLFVHAPRQTFFNVVQYQALYRRVDWPGATPHDVDVLSAWLNSTQALSMGLLAIAGAFFIIKKSNWDRARKAEFYLCGWLAVGLVAYIATAHPTFERYFLFAVPFVGIVAVAGLYAVSSRLADAERPLWPTAIVALLICLACAKALFDDRNAVTWNDYEQITRKVAQVTPPGGEIFADEMVYFLLKRIPPFGMEFSYAHKLELPPAQEKLFHLVSYKDLKRQLEAGKFATAQSCNDDRIDELGLEDLFPNHADIRDCTVFWGKVAAHPAKAAAHK